MSSRRSPMVTTGRFTPRPETSLFSTREFSPIFTLPTRSSTPGSFSSKHLSFGRSSHTSLIEETAEHVIESYGAPLPVIVTEAITSGESRERMMDVSVKIQESGWISLVCGRRLFVWRFKQDSEIRSMAANCRELTLPPSDLAHKAELVHILCNKESQVPSVIAVSPEGIVRYWPNIAHEGTSFEVAADLQGQECYSVTSVDPLGCMLATTTGSLVLIVPSLSEGQHIISCVTLRLPQGVLAGFGRKVSSFIFGAMPSQSSEAKQLSKVLCATDEDGGHSIYVLSETVFQKWRMSNDESYQLIYELDLDRYLKEGFLEALWNGDASHLLHLKTWCLDMQEYKDGVIFLMAGMNPLISKEMYYAFGVLQDPKPSTSTALSSFTVVRFFETFMQQDEEKLLGYRFIFPPGNDEKAFLYGTHKIICISVCADAEPDVIEFRKEGNLLLGAGTYEALPLFFTRLDGLVCVKPASTDKELGSFQESIKEVSTSSLIPFTKSCTTLPEKFKAAIRLFCDGENESCNRLVGEIKISLKDSSSISAFNGIIADLSLQIIDDYPISDPRWCESIPAGDAVSTSLIILHQLDDKLKAHGHLVFFLRQYEFCDMLTFVTVKEVTIQTLLLLLEHAEKLTAAKMIHKCFLEYTDLVKEVIEHVLHSRRVEVKSLLSHQDVFFREVSHIDSFFPALLKWQDNELQSDDSNAENIINTIKTVNSILVNVFEAVLRYRDQQKALYCYKNNVSQGDYISWTSAEGKEGIRTLLLQQHSVNVKYALKLPECMQTDGAIYRTFMGLVDIILDGFKSQLESLKGNLMYESAKQDFLSEQTKLISPLLEIGQLERAAVLAEKHLDFGALIQLCENTNDSERLQDYCLHFNNEGFPEFVFKWFTEKGQVGRLFKEPLIHLDNLKKFLCDHPDLQWMYQIRSENFAMATETLRQLAHQEKRFVSKKKTLLSLAKLTVLASDPTEDMKDMEFEGLNSHLDLITHQENLPSSVCETLSLFVDSSRVLDPESLIEMYISEDNVDADQYAFKTALQLVKFIPKPCGDESVEKLKQKIWCKAIKRDIWEDLDVSDPVGSVRHTLFYKLTELLCDLGEDPFDFLPPLGHLIENPELESLSGNTLFSFFIKATYEYFETLA